jgi:hypothetical protein
MMMDGMGMMICGVFSFLLGLLLVFIFLVIVVAAMKWLYGAENCPLSYRMERTL